MCVCVCVCVFECRERHVMFVCPWERLEGNEDVLCLGVCGNALKRDVQFVYGNALKWHVKFVFVCLFVCLFVCGGREDCYVCVWERFERICYVCLCVGTL